MVGQLSTSIFEFFTIDSCKHRYRFFTTIDVDTYRLSYDNKNFYGRYQTKFKNTLCDYHSSKLLKCVNENWGIGKSDGYCNYFQEWLYNRDFRVLNDGDILFYHKLANMMVNYYIRGDFQKQIWAWMKDNNFHIDWNMICLESYFDILFMIYKLIQHDNPFEINIYINVEKCKTMRKLLLMLINDNTNF